ncbi:FHA domain-containing protein [Deinococcus radiopugnans]|uniref:FHA domain-containing protein n=1 Tax=Deinococcus radiopugnans ATCC 19172 TaxID=585398 RepID=A0A5C4Y975_9DEIO|nr:FHA domain-containing protein [Deinococcus radiopugnans]MBB6017414.1 hypothetical protein [Deinococcus radiopugnans ATCC 19172]TNM71951.1 FHA domain-containing protein [Deinococcus radiopugnans ATCC 19172]
MTLTCIVCGTINPHGTTYCDGCGVELSPTAAPSELAVPSEPAHSAGEDTTAPAALEGSGWDRPTDTSSGPEQPAPLAPSLTLTKPAQDDSPASDAAPTPIPVPDAASAPLLELPVPTGTARLGLKKFGAPTGEFIPLAGERLVVGRFDASSGPVDIDVSGITGAEHISRRHAELSHEGGRWFVRDLGSTNGVYLKRAGQGNFSPRLQEPTPLAHGDELAFGNLMLTFHQD